MYEAKQATLTADSVSVTNGATVLVLAANSDRRMARIYNDSAVVIYLGFTTGHAVNKGIRLAAGQYWDCQSGGYIYTGNVYARHADGSAQPVTIYYG